MNLTPHIERFKTRFQELEDIIAAPGLYDDPSHAQKVLKEHSHIKNAIALHEKVTQLTRSLQENQKLIEANEDPELVELATEENPELEKEIASTERTLLANILPPDPNDSKNTIIEIRAGTGGNEAALFAADLFRMYSRYAERTKLQIDVMNTSPAELGGLKEIIFSTSGEDAFKKLRFESGVHRVQRVPATESQGRIHTSTATVAVMPEAQDVEVDLKTDDLRIEVCRASGPGGQGVNTTDSAVQVMHIPTGMIVRCQDGRSQIKNKEKAISILKARLYEKKQQEEQAKYAEHRKKQVGTGDRNEKIRTYNFPQNRITDHRINLTLYNLTGFMEGNIDEMITELQASEVALRLEDIEAGTSS